MTNEMKIMLSFFLSEIENMINIDGKNDLKHE